ncbi:MAG: hypothetical protein L6420_05840 [Elusimicrobia bacterium]|nr:hypothetical protein [Elusimicrobiota bacterium]
MITKFKKTLRRFSSLILHPSSFIPHPSSFIPHPSSFIPHPSSLKRKGQIIIPSLLIVPSLLLFVYLIFETAKLSREKIRHQFAIDSAAFIQMSDYTNLFNRTAYVNGTFPYRVFKEVYECPPNDYIQKTDGGGQECPYNMLYELGNFPKYKNDIKGRPPVSLDSKSKWEIEFHSSRSGMNQNPPAVSDTLTLISEEQGTKLYLFWDPAIGIYKFYAQFYTLLGSIETSQITVFERLTENFNFFRKSYYLNTGECRQNPQACAEDGVAGFKANAIRQGSNFHMHYIEKIRFWAKVPQSGIPPYYLGKTNPPIDIKLFQLATVDDDALSAAGSGYQMFQGWDTPSNYFNIDFNRLAACRETGRPCVHAMVASQCPALSSGNNCVWPNPTPKYQSRLYP